MELSQSNDDPITPEFLAALRGFIRNLAQHNGGFGTITLRVEHGRIKRFDGSYAFTVSESYTMKASR